MQVVCDTNLLIDYLTGVGDAQKVLASTDHHFAISIVSWIEVMAGAEPEAKEGLRGFLRKFEVATITSGVAEEAARIRSFRRLKLPDAVILATARVLGRPLYTRDEKDFGGDPLVQVPYRL